MTRVVIAAVMASAAAAGAARAEPTIDYVVKPGDTCIGIATRELGDRAAYTRIHKLNPQLGRLPHQLKAGQVLHIPLITPAAPDARLDGAHGDVKVHRPTDSDWSLAENGMEVFRGWRLAAAAASSADLGFRDRSHLRMRADTIVVVYGPERNTAKTISLQTTLESGSLESRLAALGGARVVVRTPDAAATLADGQAVVTIDSRGDSIVANHGGDEIEVRGYSPKRRRRVVVPALMGAKIAKGEPPSRPRLLPATPEWITAPHGFAALAGGRAPIRAEWVGVTAAARYRFAVDDDAGAPIGAIEVAAPTSRGQIDDLSPGRFRGRVSAIDGDGFESPPSGDLVLDVVAIAVVPPGSATAIGGALTTDGGIPVVAVGTALVAPDDFTCRDADGHDGARVIVVDSGATPTITCASRSGETIEPFMVSVAPVTVAVAANAGAPLLRGQRATLDLAVTSAGPIGTRLSATASRGMTVVSTAPTATGMSVVIDVGDDAPSHGVVSITSGASGASGASGTSGDLVIATVDIATVAPARSHGGGETGFEVGPFARGHGPFSVRLGGADNDMQQLSSGYGGGVRVGTAPRRRLAVEGELGLALAGSTDTANTAVVITARVGGSLRVFGDRLGARLLLGGGGHSLVTAPVGLRRNTVGFVDIGAALTAPLGRRAGLRLDARNELSLSARGIDYGIDLTLGAFFHLD